jgi:SAM-dependent methyltransferase
MCSVTSLVFCLSNLLPSEVAGKHILELGARDVNGSVRPVVETWQPASYLGVDLEPGKGVDLVLDASELLGRFGPERFDVVIATEILEHVRDWRRIVGIMKRLLKPNGVLLITTRSRGFEYHAYPADFWRFELADMAAIFADMTIDALVPDPLDPGVFLRARRPETFVEADSADLLLYCILTGGRERQINDNHLSGPRYLRLVAMLHAKQAYRKLKQSIRQR